MALQGYGSASGWGGMNDAYLEELPQYEYGKTDYGKDFTYGSAPLSNSGGSGGTPTYGSPDYVGPTPNMRGPGGSYDPSSDPYMSNLNFGFMNPKSPQYSNPRSPLFVQDTVDDVGPKTTAELWDKMQSTAYNPATKEWEPSGKFSYPHSKLFGKYSDMIGNTLAFGSPNATPTPQAMMDYSQVASDFQQGMLDFHHNNPTATQGQLENFIHKGAAPQTSEFWDNLDSIHGGEPGSNSGATSGFGFNPDHSFGTEQVSNVMGGGNQWDTGWSGESGAAGGAGDFFMNKGGQVSGGK